MNEKIHKAIRQLKNIVDRDVMATYDIKPEIAAELLSALPDDLVAAATVEMPKEPGLYVGPGGTRGPVWRKEADGELHLEHGWEFATTADGPFRRLVAEGDGPTHVFTGEELYQVWLDDPRRASEAFGAVAHFVNTYTPKEA